MNEEKIKNNLENDGEYQNIKKITINISTLIQLLIYKKIITEEEFESAMGIISKFYEEKEDESIRKIIDKGDDKNE